MPTERLELDDLFTPEEQARLLCSLGTTPGGFSYAEGLLALQRAAEIRAAALALDLVLAGELQLRLAGEDGALRFVAPERPRPSVPSGRA